MASNPANNPAITTAPAGVGDLALTDFPEDLRPIIRKVNDAVRATRLVRDRAQGSPPHFKVPAGEAFTQTRSVQALLGGMGRQILEQLADWREVGVSIALRIQSQVFTNQFSQADPATVRGMLEEFEGTIEYFLSEAETPRPTTSAGNLAVRQAETALIVAQGQARAQAALAQTTSAILRLPQAWLQNQFDTHYPPQHRVRNAQNPSGCWFQSMGDAHRTQYQQKNWSRTVAPANSIGPWVQPGGVIGCQPR